MKTPLYLTFALTFLTACSTTQVSRNRTPSSVPMEQRSCSELISNFTGVSQKNYSISALENLKIDIQSIKDNSTYKALAHLNGNEEVREKTYYILALLRKHYPNELEDKIIKRYRDMLKDCS